MTPTISPKDSNHTEPEWKVEPFVDNRKLGGEHHTYRITPQRGVYGSMFEEDAILACAAPKLLRALKALFDNYKQLADSGDAGFWKLEDLAVGRQALEAIAKAEGRIHQPAPAKEGAE